MPGIDNFTKLLLHFEGTDGDQTTTDDSGNSHVVAFSGGSTEIDTAQSKFGVSSCVFDDVNNLTVVNSSDWDFGTGDFTIDGWIRLNDLGNNMLCARTTSGVSYFYFGFEGTNLRFRDYNSGNNIDIQNNIAGLTTGQWYHLAVSKQSGTFRIYVDGTQVGSDVVNNNAFIARTDPLEIGSMSQNAGYYLNGHIDEFRLSKGIARYTGASFTLETEPYDLTSAYRKQFTIDNTKIDAVELNLPVEVKLDSTNFDFSNALADGADIVFRDSDGLTLLDFERVYHEYSPGLGSPETVLLMHFNDATDSSQYSKVPVLVGNAQIDATDKQFGSGSLLLDGDGDYVTVPHDSTLTIGDKDFTMECFAKVGALQDEFPMFASKWDSIPGGDREFQWFWRTNNTLNLGYSFDGAASLSVNVPFTPVIDQWYHFAVSKEGGNVRFFVDGTQQGTTQVIPTTPFYTSVGDLHIGTYFNAGASAGSGGNEGEWNGNIDEMRITIGKSLYNSNFTVQTSEHVLEDIARAQYFVKIPTVSDTVDTIFYMYYGDAGGVDISSPTDVWESDDKCVFHMLDNTPSTFLDSTINGNVANKDAANNPLEVTTDLGKGQEFNGLDSIVNVPSSATTNYGSPVTWTIWFTWNGNNGQSQDLITKWRNPYDLKITMDDSASGGGDFRMAWGGIFRGTGFSTAGLDDGLLHVCHVAVGGGQTKVYIDNILKETIAGNPGNGSGFDIGNEAGTIHEFNGTMYEVRLANTTKSDAYLKAETHSGFGTLMTIGAEEALSATEYLVDVNADIRTVLPTNFADVDTDIRTVAESAEDVNTDIRATFPINFVDINTDIRTHVLSTNDISTDIRAGYLLGEEDINTDIRTIKLSPDFKAGFKSRKLLSIDPVTLGISAPLSNFPILVKLDNTNFDFSLARADGFDVCFTDNDGQTLLSFEREAYDNTGEEAYFWVKIPTISNLSPSTFYVYYQNPDATDPILTADLTTSGGASTRAFASSEVGFDPASEAFDNATVNQLWRSVVEPFPHWIAWDFQVGNEKTINYYTIVSPNVTPANAPYDWILQGSNNSTNGDDGTWTNLDVRVNEVFGTNEKRSFNNFSEGENTTAYKFYRLYITDNQPAAGFTQTGIEEIEFMEGLVDPTDVWDSDYIAVYHMVDDSGQGLDSTVNAYDATVLPPGGGVPGLVNETFLWDSDDVDPFGFGDEMRIDSAGNQLNGNVTIEAFINPSFFNVEGVDKQPIVVQGDGAFNAPNNEDDDDSRALSVGIQGQKLTVYVGNDSGQDQILVASTLANINTSTWYYVAGKADGSDISAILDNTKETLSQTVTPTSGFSQTRIGRFGQEQRHYQGLIDEVRLSSIARSDDWLEATRQSVVGTPITFGAEDNLCLIDIGTDIRVEPNPALITESLNDVFNLIEAATCGPDVTPGLGITASDDFGGSFPATNAIDDDNGTLWLTSTATADEWIEVDLGLGLEKKIRAYTIESTSGNSNSPTDWTFEGSNTLGGGPSAVWDVIHTQTNVVFNPSEVKLFSALLNNTEYRYYRLNITDSNSGTNVEIAELQMFECSVVGDSLTLTDVSTDIRIKHTEVVEDVNTDIRAHATSLNDVSSDIRIQFTPVVADINTDVRTIAQSTNDLNTDIRTQFTPVVEDVNTDIRIKANFNFEDINTDIRVVGIDPTFADISTDIRAYHVIPISLVTVTQLSFQEGVFLNTNTVTLEMEVYGAVKMQFRNEDTPTWSALEVYNDTKIINLSAGDGDKAVYIRFQDILGNFTSGNDNIQGIVQTTAPLEPTIEAYTDETATVAITDSVYTNDNNPFFQWSIPISAIPYELFIFELDDPIDNTTSGNLITPDIVRDGIILSKATPFPEMTLETTDGYYYYGADLKEYNAQSLALDDGGVLDRIDLVYISAINESLNIEKGVESATPVAPEVPQDGIILATAYVPAAETLIANVTLTDIRETKVQLNKYVNQNIETGQHVFRVKGVLANEVESTIAEFNLYIANPSPDMGEILGYTDVTKVTELANGVYETATASVFLEWTASPAEPGPIQYHYTVDGTEPTLASPFTTSTSITLGPFPEGSTVITFKPFDTVSGSSGQTRSFTLVFGSQDFTNDTAVIVGGTVLRQSLKEVEVRSISWDFDSARTCRIFVPVLFDETISLDIGTKVSVVYGSTNATVFIGTVKIVERVIDAGKEMIMCNCVGPRGQLNECFAVIDDPILGNTAQIEFEDLPIGQAITTIANTVPNVIKRIDSLPNGANVSDRFIAQSVSQVISRIYERTKFAWYMKPDGTLISVDITADNPGEAKFGVFGTTVNSLTPQFNVMASNLQFDVTNRYSKAVIEGARRRELKRISARCGAPAVSEETLVNQNDRASGSKYKIFTLNTDQKVVKVIETFVTYGRIKQMTLYPIPTSNVGGGISSFNITLNEWEVCRSNKLIKFTRKAIYNTNAAGNAGIVNKGNTQFPTGSGFFGGSQGVPATSKLVGFAATPTSTESVEVQGSLGPNNTIRFSREMYNFWPTGTSLNTGGTIITRPGLNIKDGVPNYFWRNPPKKKCASVSADVLIETTPLRVAVSAPGTADTDKVLRIVKTQFKYDEDPANPIDDTAEMTQYALDALEEFKDIKINGTIVLDTVDISWDLNKTVNLINTQQGSWSTLNITIVGIEFDFTSNTTTLEITSEYLT